MTKVEGRRLGWKEFLLSLFLIVVVWASGNLFFGGGRDPRVVETEGRVQVLFTSPHGRGDEQDAGGLDAVLAQAIDAAQERVDVAAYNLDLRTVAEALVTAHRRGLTVRMVTDSDHLDESGTARVREAGIPVVGDIEDTLMHNKFVIIDGREVWTGSWNLTENGTYRNNNNVLRIDSPALAKTYTDEFEEMFTHRIFSAGSPEDPPSLEVEVDDILIESYFSPEDTTRQHIIELLESAERSIHFMAFTLTDTGIAQALNQRYKAGVQVQGVVETRNINDQGSDVEALQQVGLDVRLDGNPYNMHHKVIVIDEAVVITGSYNFSRSAAEYNDENVLILHSSEIARHYLEEFKRLYTEAEEVNHE
ncbi:MAG: phospholipase D-like domain-containing protein [Anaerolineae bacterium]